MTVSLQRRVLVGGVGLSLSLWLLQDLSHSIVQLGEIGVCGAIAVGGGLWLFKQRAKKTQLKLDAPLSRATVEQAIAEVETIVEQLAIEAEPVAAQLRSQVAQLTALLDREKLNLAVTGGKSVGKTTLVKVLSQSLPQIANGQTQLLETPPLFTGVAAGEDLEATAKAAALAADMVLFVINGDLTNSEFQFLQQLKLEQRVLLVFNKQDQYLPDERAVVLQSLRQIHEVVAAAASPNSIKVRQHTADGVLVRMEQPQPDIQQLKAQLSEITQQTPQLVWASTARAAGLLKIVAKNSLNVVRRDRALPMIEQSQWIAATAAFANPVPVLDILATAAINAQMVMDLATIYQQKFSWEQAQTVALTMGSLMLKLGLVELSTQAISSILKTNAVTFVAGGVVQGLSAAHLTRIAGLSLIEYFQEQEVAIETGNALNLDKLKQTLQNVFQQHQQIGVFQHFVKQGKRLLPSSSVELSASGT